MRITVKAFGCKLTQCEAGAIERGLVAAGHEIVSKSPFDAVIVCGCTVTARADYKVRQYFRRMVREHGVKRLFLAGCSAVSFSEETIVELGIERAFPTNDPIPILDYIGVVDTRKPDFKTFHGRTRGYVKIQDGCDQFCAYCIVPHVRGPERSVPVENVLMRVRELVESGVKEAVLTGVHDGRYFTDNHDLAGLCNRILRGTGIERIRLSSVECLQIGEGMLRLLATETRLAKHLHIPLQSGSDSVLAAMNRQYTSAQYSEIVRRVAVEVEDIGIGADVIVGFPGETEGDFRETFELIDSLPISYLHLFRYSPRPGTPAATMPNQVHSETVRERMEALRDLHERLRERFARSQFGKERRVIIESVQSGIGSGWTDNYLRAQAPLSNKAKNKIVVLKPISYKNGIVCCETIHSA